VTYRPASNRVGPWRRAAPWAVAALILSTVGLPAAAGAFGRLPNAPQIGLARPLNATTLRINMTDTPRFTPAYNTVSAGTNATFHLVNEGAYNHSFTLLKQSGVVLNTSWTPGEVNAYLAANGSLANVTVAGGGQANVTVEFGPETGFDSFEFISAIPYQFQAGMYGFVNVSSTQPGLMAQENTTDAPAFVPDEIAVSTANLPFNLDVLVTNLGGFAHTFTVASQSNVTLSPANFTTYFQQHAPLVSVPIPAGAGSTAWANFTVPARGVYQYICEIPGHFASGMTGYLYVDVPPPPPVPPLSTAVVQAWILVGSAVLLGIGILLSVAAAYVGRFPATPPSHGEGEHH
jgi:uncharacterized cupredoxin-like copper-binding protein